MLVTGPRQSGKTTFLLEEFGGGARYLTLDNPLEVDLLLRLPGGLLPIEIKLTATPMPRHAAGLGKFKELAGKAAATEGVLVCCVPEPTPLPFGNLALPWQQFPAWLREKLEPASPAFS